MKKKLVEVCLKGDAPARFLKLFPEATVTVEASGGRLSAARAKIFLHYHQESDDYHHKDYWLKFYPGSERLSLIYLRHTDKKYHQAEMLIDEQNVRLVSYVETLSQFTLTDYLKRQLKRLCGKKLTDDEFEKQMSSLLALSLL